MKDTHPISPPSIDKTWPNSSSSPMINAPPINTPQTCQPLLWLCLHLHLCLVLEKRILKINRISTPEFPKRILRNGCFYICILEKWSSRISRFLYFSIHQEEELLQMLLLREGTEIVPEIQVRSYIYVRGF